MTAHDFIPARSTNSIIGAAFACEMTAPLSTEIIDTVIKAYESASDIRQFLPAKMEERGLKIDIGHQTAQMEPPGALMGVRFERYSPDGRPEWSLSFRANVAVVLCNSYTRWQEVAPQAMQLLKWGMQTISSYEVGLTAIGLEYQDEYVWQGDLQKMDATPLFSKSNGILPESLLTRKGLWHNYSGWFEEAAESVPGRRLVNVNVALVQRADKGVAQVVFSHKGIFPDASEAPTDPTNLFNALHKEHKQLFGRLMADPIKLKIRFDQHYAN